MPAVAAGGAWHACADVTARERHPGCHNLKVKMVHHMAAEGGAAGKAGCSDHATKLLRGSKDEMVEGEMEQSSSTI